MTRRRQQKVRQNIQDQPRNHRSWLRATVRVSDQGSRKSRPAGNVSADRRVQTVFGVLVFALAFSTAFGLHGSSIAIWNAIERGRNPNAGILVGTPKSIRSDEFALQTPAMISQAKSHPPFPRAN